MFSLTSEESLKKFNHELAIYTNTEYSNKAQRMIVLIRTLITKYDSLQILLVKHLIHQEVEKPKILSHLSKREIALADQSIQQEVIQIFQFFFELCKKSNSPKKVRSAYGNFNWLDNELKKFVHTRPQPIINTKSLTKLLTLDSPRNITSTNTIRMPKTSEDDKINNNNVYGFWNDKQVYDDKYLNFANFRLNLRHRDLRFWGMKKFMGRKD